MVPLYLKAGYRVIAADGPAQRPVIGPVILAVDLVAEGEPRRRAEAERQRELKAAEAREREWLENRPWL